MQSIKIRYECSIEGCDQIAEIGEDKIPIGWRFITDVGHLGMPGYLHLCPYCHRRYSYWLEQFLRTHPSEITDRNIEVRKSADGDKYVAFSRGLPVIFATYGATLAEATDAMVALIADWSRGSCQGPKAKK